MSSSADPNGSAAAAAGQGSPPPLFGANEEPSERLMNAFVLVFLVVLVLCMILSHQMGHKFHVRVHMWCVWGLCVFVVLILLRRTGQAGAP